MKKAIVLGIVVAVASYMALDTFDPETIKGKNVVITGASSGIGEQMAYHYTRLGANVVVTARREQRLKKVIAECRTVGIRDGQYHFVALDMANELAPQKLIKFAEERLGGIDILVLNHAVLHPTLWEGTPENITNLRLSMEVNFFAYVTTATYATAALEKSKGSLIVMNALLGKIPNPLWANYVSAKHALHGFFGSLREEFIVQKKDISITMCFLGLIDTENVMNIFEGLYNMNVLEIFFPRTDASDTALAVIKAAARGDEELYYPLSQTKPNIFLYNAAPDTYRYLLRKLFPMLF